MYLIKNESNLSKVLFGIVVILICYGILMMYSASAVLGKNQFNSHTHFLIKQLFWLVIGFVGFIISYSFNYKNIKKNIFLLLSISFVAMVIPYFIENYPICKKNCFLEID